MDQATDTPLKKTPLNARHRASGARMVPFGGWDMPVEYSGITAEHMAVRSAAGLFDVSHMGEVEIAGKGALEAVQHITSNDASKLQVGQIQYSGLTTPQGTFVDDLLVYRFGPSHYLLVVNAGNIQKDYEWIAARAKEAVPEVATVNSSDRYALIAVQGPKAELILQTLTAIDLAAIKYYWFAHGEIAGIRGTVSRTGYTGEDGFEVMVPNTMAAKVWDALMQAGKPHGLIPAGLGARDTLRLEASMRLYGNDIDDTTTVMADPVIVGWKKTEFGRDVIVGQKPTAPEGHQRLATERAIGRHGHPVFHDGKQVGVVTSVHRPRFSRRRSGWRMARGVAEHQIETTSAPPRKPSCPDAVYKRPVLGRDTGNSYRPLDTKEHEWIRLDGGVDAVGITDFAQQQLGDVVYVELPEVGTTLTAGQVFGTIESVKAVSELFAPVTGEVVEVNGRLKDKPEDVNSKPHEAWMVKVKLANPGDASGLLDASAYEALIAK